MKVVSIISEYNPFHNGHKYMIQKARENGATHIAAVMSGSVVQRGDAAVFDKHERAGIALENGCDLVAELPCPFCVSSAEVFARAGVKIAAHLCSDALCFGAECGDMSVLKEAAEASREISSGRFKDELNSEIRVGSSYPSAFFSVVKRHYSSLVAKVFETPNNVLAVEYIKALEKTGISPEAVIRCGPGHDGAEICGEFASASKIRSMILNGEDISGLVPGEYTGEVFNINKMERGILFLLKSMTREELLDIPDCGGDLADRIIKALGTSCSLESLFENIKTKAYTMARIRRIVISAVLGIKKEDLSLLPYVRILALNERGAQILSRAAKKGGADISSSLKELERKSENNKRLARLSVLSGEFQRLCSIGEYIPKNEYSVKIEKVN